jgi:uncharacterized protein YecE (DUF72 family)
MKQPEIHVGTSGWTYDDWSGPFYPKDVRVAARLAYYARQFDTVEVNATFYRLPTQAMIDAWNRTLPEQYRLVLKGSRYVTHLRKLVDCEEALAAFWERARQLRAIKVILWQLPPSLGKDVDRLARFLGGLPEEVRHAIEFRHASWWERPEDVEAVLARHRAAWVGVSYSGLPDSILPTTDFLYVRFHGLGKERYRYDYSRSELQDWAVRLVPHLAGRALYAFFNNDYEANAPRNAMVFRELLQDVRKGL